MTRGLVIGKFYPPHKGHSYLINKALEQASQVTVLVCDLPGQEIPAATRASWLQEIHPAAEVRVIPDIGHDDDSILWAGYTRRLLGYAPDVVFSSEEYGEAYARHLGCRHVSVDRERKAFAISGTQVREAPLANWEFLEPCVRAYFARRVCVVGAESSGTTTMARALAEHYRTVWVPEVGRMYSEGKFTAADASQWSSAEFAFIADAQNRLEDQLARLCDRLLVCDTNSWATRLWHERYLGHLSAEVDSLAMTHPCHLYLLTDVNIPFVQDGLRDGEHMRTGMHRRFTQELSAQSVPFIVLSGDHKTRLEIAIKACDALLAVRGATR